MSAQISITDTTNKYAQMNIYLINNRVTPIDISINVSSDQNKGNDFHNKETEKEIRKRLIEQYKADIYNTIINDEFESGEISNCERFIINKVNNNNIEYTKEAANELYLENYKEHPDILVGLYIMLGTLTYADAYPQGQTMALGGLQHREIEVRDRAIQMFERWNSKKGIPVLEGLHCDQQWLQKYVSEVIRYLYRDGEE